MKKPLLRRGCRFPDPVKSVMTGFVYDLDLLDLITLLQHHRFAIGDERSPRLYLKPLTVKLLAPSMSSCQVASPHRVHTGASTVDFSFGVDKETNVIELTNLVGFSHCDAAPGYRYLGSDRHCRIRSPLNLHSHQIDKRFPAPRGQIQQSHMSQTHVGFGLSFML